MTDFWTDYASEAQIRARDSRAAWAKARTLKAIALVQTGRTVADVCRSLGMSRATFYVNCKAHGFDIHALREAIADPVDPLLL